MFACAALMLCMDPYPACSVELYCASPKADLDLLQSRHSVTLTLFNTAYFEMILLENDISIVLMAQNLSGITPEWRVCQLSIHSHEPTFLSCCTSS